MKRICTALSLAAAVMLQSCTYRVPDNPFFDKESVPAAPCIVSSDTTVVIVRDYFPGIGRVDTVTCGDYEVVPVSREGMDTVQVVARPASRFISILTVSSGSEKGAIVLKRQVAEGPGTPVVSTAGSTMGGREFTVEVKNTPASYLVLWQNTLLDRNCLSYRKNGVFTVHVPYNALDVDTSFIRIFSHNAAGAGGDITVPVFRGRVMLSGRTEF